MTAEQRTEQRSHARKSIAHGHRGQLTMQINGRQLGLDTVVDVSPAGIGLIVDEDVVVGSPVEVSYQLDSINIHMSGVVIWASNQSRFGDGNGDTTKFAVGVSLTGPTLLYTLL